MLRDIIFTGYKYHYFDNAIFFCKSEIYGDCVLKIGGNNQDKEFISEFNVLHEYNGNRRYIKIYESDIDIEKREMRGTQPTYDESFKKSIVNVQQNGKSQSELHREYGGK